MIRLLLLVCLGSFCIASVQSYTYKYMWSDCGSLGGTEQYTVFTYGMKLFGANDYGRGYYKGTCTAVLQASLSGKRLMIRFTDFDLFLNDAVNVYDGRDKYAPRLTGNSLSGANSDTGKVYRSSGKYLTVVFEASQADFSSEGFEAVVTPFETGYCESFNFKCCDGDCIDDTFRWDGLKNCQDGSDEELNCISASAIAGITIGAAIGGACLIALISFCIIRSKRANMRATRATMNVATVTGHSGTIAQPYYPQQNYATAAMAPPSYASVIQQGYGYQHPPPAQANTSMPQ